MPKLVTPASCYLFNDGRVVAALHAWKKEASDRTLSQTHWYVHWYRNQLRDAFPGARTLLPRLAIGTLAPFSGQKSFSLASLDLEAEF